MDGDCFRAASRGGGDVSLQDLLIAFHADHTCKPGRCKCKCGCQVAMGCQNHSDLCSVCHVRMLRDDEDGEHGEVDVGAQEGPKP